jgi:hypothetical protein
MVYGDGAQIVSKDRGEKIEALLGESWMAALKTCNTLNPFASPERQSYRRFAMLC